METTPAVFQTVSPQPAVAAAPLPHKGYLKPKFDFSGSLLPATGYLKNPVKPCNRPPPPPHLGL
ncbi:hypothetical protein [Eikenella longinqua]|uniref:hypothetical protein n=1 Tax=Eikenella longinqua TaxID=1795827 RepID=UPI0012E7BBB5|nr:hypothetical protein [Eikenella longinqua]